MSAGGGAVRTLCLKPTNPDCLTQRLIMNNFSSASYASNKMDCFRLEWKGAEYIPQMQNFR